MIQLIQRSSGTFSNNTGLKSELECTNCTGGMYCETAGLTSPTGNCSAGYYCPLGSIYPQTNETGCEPGFYCPGGTEEQLPCEEGTYVGFNVLVDNFDSDKVFFLFNI